MLSPQIPNILPDPSTIAGAIVWGIVAGILSAGFLIALQLAWEKIFTPWYEERLYQGARIEGFWHSRTIYQDGDENEMVYQLHRKGHRIWGDIACIGGIDKGRKWNFSGRFKDLILSFHYESAHPRVLDKGSASLMLTHNGEKLEGHLIYYANKGNQMKSVPLVLEPDQLPKQS